MAANEFTGMSLDTPSLPRWREGVFDIDLSRQRVDDEDIVEITATDPEDVSIHVTCKGVIADDGRVMLFVGFAVAAYEVALREDLPLQEAANDALTAALGTVFVDQPETAADFCVQFCAAWMRWLAYFEERMAVIKARGLLPDRLSVYHSSSNSAPALASYTTRMGKDELFGVKRRRSGYSQIHGISPTHDAVSPPTQALLAGLSDISGHTKLELLSGTDGAEYQAARLEFDRYRKIGRDRVCAVRTTGAVATQCQGSQEFSAILTFRNGDEGRYSIYAYDKSDPKFSLTLDLKQEKDGLRVTREKDGTFLLARAFNEKRFKTPGHLDQALRRLIDMVLMVDAPAPGWALPDQTPPFDPAHPVLDGRIIPPRHQPLIATLLATPYDEARGKAERFAESRAKKQAKVVAAAGLPDQIPDGAMLKGSASRRNVLCMAKTVPSPGKRRRRALEYLRGGPKDTPLTAKHLSRLELLEAPTALDICSDVALGIKDREFVEAAFRLSFDLEPGALNPLLQGKIARELYEISADLPYVRMTRIDGADDCSLLALAVHARPCRVTCSYPYGWTGAAFVMERVFGKDRCHLRPARRSKKISLPEKDREVLDAAILRHCKEYPSDGPAEPMLAALDGKWNTLIGESGKT